MIFQNLSKSTKLFPKTYFILTQLYSLGEYRSKLNRFEIERSTDVYKFQLNEGKVGQPDRDLTVAGEKVLMLTSLLGNKTLNYSFGKKKPNLTR